MNLMKISEMIVCKGLDIFDDSKKLISIAAKYWHLNIVLKCELLKLF